MSNPFHDPDNLHPSDDGYIDPDTGWGGFYVHTLRRHFDNEEELQEHLDAYGNRPAPEDED